MLYKRDAYCTLHHRLINEQIIFYKNVLIDINNYL